MRGYCGGRPVPGAFRVYFVSPILGRGLSIDADMVASRFSRLP